MPGERESDANEIGNEREREREGRLFGANVRKRISGYVLQYFPHLPARRNNITVPNAKYGEIENND
jgi:hypothetical protein